MKIDVVVNKSKINLKNKKVAILLCTLQGEKYIEDQINSFLNQSYKNWTLYVSDDHSTDKTKEIVEKFQVMYGLEKIIRIGPRNGFAAHFIELTSNEKIKADYFAWSDQDDIWEQDKLDVAVKWLNLQPELKPVVFSSRTTLVDKNNMIIGISPLFKKPKTFRNALVQNVGGGNTMVFNSAARELLNSVSLASNAVSHDWLMYQVVTGCGGVFHNDSRPLVRYRQHENNAVGMNNSLGAKLNRLVKIINGRYQIWNCKNIEIIKSIEQKLLKENQKILHDFYLAKSCNSIKRLIHLKNSGVYRQGTAENIMLYLACFFQKI